MQKLRELYNFIVEKSAPSKIDWKALGYYLGLHDNTIKEIENLSSSLGNCLYECLSRWLQRCDSVDHKGGPTCSTLKNALIKLGEKDIADNFADKFQPKGQFCSHMSLV